MAWEQDEDKKTWSQDDMLVRAGKGVGGGTIYHCYKADRYVAQTKDLKEAQAACMKAKAPEPKKED